MAIGWAEAWALVAIAIAAALLVAVLALGFSRRVNRAFALYLSVGIGHGLTTLVAEAGTPAQAALAARLFPYFNLNDEIALLWFLSVYTGWPRRLHRGPWAAAAFACVSATLVSLHLLDPQLYFGSVAPGEPYGEGPLATVDYYVWSMHTLVALVLAAGYFRAAPAERSPSALLTSAALALNVVIWHPAWLVGVVTGVREGVAPLVPGYVIHAALVLALLAYVASRMRSRDAAARSAAGRYAGAIGLIAALATARPWLPSWTDFGFQALGSLGILLLAYALLRHQLFGLDRRVRFALSRGTIAAAFVAVFFVASEGAQILFGTESEWVGLIAAGALVFAMAPLQRAAERLAERAVPVAGGALAESFAPPTDGRAAYRVLLRRFLTDGRVSAEEELALAHVATQAALTPAEVVRLRHDVEAELAREEVA